uniref:Uncharacterized protein n=1 Tax=Meloidogyne floridensis TaxID=298350 RepID=A0A915NFK8_9BILA
MQQQKYQPSMMPTYFPDFQQLQTFFNPLTNSNIPPVLNQPKFENSVALNDNQKNNNGWKIESFTFQKCTKLLEYFRLNNPNEEAKSKECVLAKGICDSIDKVNNWLRNKLQIKLVNEQNI